jgi:hypothetical protein
VEQVPAERAIVGEARHRRSRGEHQMEGHASGEGGDRHGLVVDGHNALPAADLLLHEVLEQVAALGAVRVSGEALALARHGRRHERERVELSVRVRKRRSRLLALVHDHVDVGRVVVCAHPLAPHGHRGVHLGGVELGERGHSVGRVDNDLVGADRRALGEQVGLAAPGGQRIRARAAAVARQGRVEVRHHPDTPVAVLAQRVHLGRRPVLVPGRERVALGIDRLPRLHVEERAGPRAALARDDHTQAGERVDAEFRTH